MVQTKAELREQIKNLEAQLRDVKAQLSLELHNRDEIIKNAKEAAVEEYKNKEYRKFVEYNGEFLDRYMTEFLSQKLSIETGYDNGYINVKLSVNGDVISSDDSDIYMPLGWG